MIEWAFDDETSYWWGVGGELEWLIRVTKDGFFQPMRHGEILGGVVPTLAAAKAVCERTSLPVDPFAQASDTGAETPSLVAKLTPRELEIFQLIGEGMTSGTIARKLHVSSHTIDSHRDNIKRKVGAKNSPELIRQAIMWVLESQP